MNPLAVLRSECEKVLDQNWLGASTKPSSHLYPHQWSWDSAFAAIGHARSGRSDRATTELRTLFQAQWSTGMVPHMVFDQSATDYHPSPEFWGTRTIDAMPPAVLTSGICQPAVHAMAVRMIGSHLDAEGRSAFFADMFERLGAWHDYLHRTRAQGSTLLEIWHPWESGMDNSPLWDDALARLHLSPEEVPAYRRVDIDHTAAAERPTAAEYDRYAYLVENLRLAQYQPPPQTVPFRVCDVLFNVVAAQADAHLAHIARSIGAPAGEYDERSRALTRAIVIDLWSEDHGIFLDLDRVTGAPINIKTATGLLPLALDVPSEIHTRLLDTFHRHFVLPAPHVEGGSLLPTVAHDAAEFDPDRYWRGPVWINILWLLVEALDDSADASVAESLARGAIALVEHSGFNEYFNPYTGSGRGASGFTWTAALTLELLARMNNP